MNNKMIELVDYIVRQFVAEPDKLSITAEESENNVNIIITAADNDMGKIIGKQGRIAKAIRTIVKSASSREKQSYYVQIKDSVEGKTQDEDNA